MKAMILAAGLGTRLGPLSRNRPKALAEVDGHTLLEITLQRLRSFGITEVIINVHHFADMVIDYLHANHNFGMQVAISREEKLLDTGGGLKNAAHFFCDSGGPHPPSVGECGDAMSCISDEPFILHNVDVLSNIDLNEMAREHRARGALATLAVQQRQTSRSLLFDLQLELCGRQIGDAAPEMVRSAPAEPLAFAGVHILSPRIFRLMNSGQSANPSNGSGNPGAFPIIPEYLRLAGAGEKIVGFRADGFYWRDLGTPASLAQATADVQHQLVQI